MIKFDLQTYTKDFINDEQIKTYENKLNSLSESLITGEMTGWYHLDKLFEKNLIADIKKTATFIQDNCEVFIVIGIGGSYLGAKAAIEALNPYFYNDFKKPQIYFVGTNLSSDYYHDLISIIKDKSIIVNVISKSGTTLETLIAYNLIMDLMKEKYDDTELSKRIIVTTDEHRGALREEVNRKRYKSFIMPDNIGGRYCLFSPVGLLPMAVANINLATLYKGALQANNDFTMQMRYAIIRKLINEQGKTVEAFIAYEPKLYDFMEWLKQLYGESLGKEEKGILPISFINTRDLHSLGQFVQQGSKILFETVFKVENSIHDINIEQYNKSLNEINNIASEATSIAHLKGGVLNNVITLSSIDEETLGYLFQFFMISCVISANLDNVNPFDQEGVEEYKQVMRQMMS